MSDAGILDASCLGIDDPKPENPTADLPPVSSYLPSAKNKNLHTISTASDIGTIDGNRARNVAATFSTLFKAVPTEATHYCCGFYLLSAFWACFLLR